MFLACGWKLEYQEEVRASAEKTGGEIIEVGNKDRNENSANIKRKRE